MLTQRTAVREISDMDTSHRKAWAPGPTSAKATRRLRLEFGLRHGWILISAGFNVFFNRVAKERISSCYFYCFGTKASILLGFG